MGVIAKALCGIKGCMVGSPTSTMGISFSVMPGVLSGMPTVHFTHLNAHWPCFYVGLPPTAARGHFQNPGLEYPKCRAFLKGAFWNVWIQRWWVIIALHSACMECVKTVKQNH